MTDMKATYVEPKDDDLRPYARFMLTLHTTPAYYEAHLRYVAIDECGNKGYGHSELEAIKHVLEIDRGE